MIIYIGAVLIYSRPSLSLPLRPTVDRQNGNPMLLLRKVVKTPKLGLLDPVIPEAGATTVPSRPLNPEQGAEQPRRHKQVRQQ